MSLRVRGKEACVPPMALSVGLRFMHTVPRPHQSGYDYGAPSTTEKGNLEQPGILDQHLLLPCWSPETEFPVLTLHEHHWELLNIHVHQIP